MDDRVTFPGDVCSVYESPTDEALMEEYNASDFFVSASTCEGFGFPVCEAMACGLPAVANNTSAVTEHVGSGGERGWLVEGRPDVYPPARMVKVAVPLEMADAILRACNCLAGYDARSPGLGPQKTDGMEGIRNRCEEYAKRMDWPRAKASFIAALGRAVEGQGIPVEEL